jgi:hypothetical protein
MMSTRRSIAFSLFVAGAVAFGAFLGPCNSNADCAAPSKGCSKQHRCKLPSSQ